MQTYGALSYDEPIIINFTRFARKFAVNGSQNPVKIIFLVGLEQI